MKLINNRLIKSVFLIMTLLMNSWVFLYTRDYAILGVVGGFSVVVIIGGLAYEKSYKNHMENTLIQLSDMLSEIINMKNTQIFDVDKDTLFGKLQHQTNRLTGILNQKNLQIEREKNEIKGLVSDIAHQLKVPATNLKMYSEFLEDENLSIEERKEFNEIINLSLDRLIFLIESMIKMSRLEGGVIQLKKRNQSLNDTVLMALGEVQKKAKVKNIDIKLEEVHKVIITHDKNWIEESLVNILENAIKYTKEMGNISVRIENYEMFSRVDIEDNGIGISEEELPKIFTRFYRGTNTREVEGIGIGLYLSREIVTKHEGYIKVSSSEKGSKFSIFLPNKNID